MNHQQKTILEISFGQSSITAFRYCSGSYRRNLATISEEVLLKMPKLKGVTFVTAIIEHYRRHESSVEEALIEMYLTGVSVRRVEDITEALWGSKVSHWPSMS
jgi:transposase-like protein